MTPIPAAVGPAAGAPQFLKGIGKIDGDGFKDTTRKGEVVFTYAQTLPEPYEPGQYPRVGNTGYSASTRQFDFTPATVDEVREHIEARLAAAANELARAKKLANDLGEIIHNMTVTQQAAWIEWRHGKGAKEAMTWIHNGLVGPGLIPDEDKPYGKEAQAWFDANCANPMPTCFCGRPSNLLCMGKGFCSDAHYDQHREDCDFPRWPMRIEAQNYRNGFQPSLVIEAPEGVTIKCLQHADDEDE